MADKADEAGPRRVGLLDGAGRDDASLREAQVIGERAAEAGFDWPDVRGVRDKLDEELRELDEALGSGDERAIAEELGDVLFTLTRLGSKVGVAPDDALRACIARFRQRFAAMEDEARAQGRALAGMTERELDVLWRRAKASLARPG